MRGLPPPRPIPIRERSSILFLEKGRLDVLDGAFVLVDEQGVRVHIPIGGVVCNHKSGSRLVNNTLQ